LDYPRCIQMVAEVMRALSRGDTRQLLRGIIDLDKGRAFGVMPGAMAMDGPFGAKIISVFPENFALGRQSHQGMVLLFDPESGAPVAVVHAGEITAIRTAAASAVATDALALPGASRLAVLGYGEQAHAHIVALSHVRGLERVSVWGRSSERAAAFAARTSEELGLTIHVAESVKAAVADADMICTTTAAVTPILAGRWIVPGCHVNLVGSSRAGAAEADNDLVVRSRFFVDHRESVLNQGGEFLSAKAAGLIGDDHVAGEIGSVLEGSSPGRVAEADITVYKSLGSIVQDLGTAWDLYLLSREEGFGLVVPF
jgi:ornithine cyclodeaminase